MKTQRLISAIVILSSFGLFTSAADAQRDRTVNCDRGGSIQAKLNSLLDRSGTVVINVTGTCEENVEIRRDDVTIDGNNSATVVGTISVRGSSRINIRGLAVTGPGRGIELYHSNAILDNLNVYNNSPDGIWSIQESWVSVNNSVVSGSTFGAFAQDSTLESFNSEFSNNFFVGIQLDVGANAIINSSRLFNNGQGINNALNSVALVSNGTEISGNGYGVYMDEDSSLRIDGPGVIISGNTSYDLFCLDSESSYKIRNNPPITGIVSCTDFNQATPAP